MSKNITAKRTSKKASATAKATTAKKKAVVKKAKAYDYSKLFKAAVADGSTSYAIGDNSNGTAARGGVGSHDRSSDGKPSDKHRMFIAVCEALKAGRIDSVNVKALSKRFPDRTLGTIRSWLGNWKRGLAGGALFPGDGSGKCAGGISHTDAEKLFAKLRANG